MLRTGPFYNTGTSGTGGSATHRPTAEDVLDGWTPTTSTLSCSPDAPHNDVYAGLANFPSDAGLAALPPDDLTNAGNSPLHSAFSLTDSSPLGGSSFGTTALKSALKSATAVAEQPELHTTSMAGQPLRMCGPANGFPQDSSDQSILPER